MQLQGEGLGVDAVHNQVEDLIVLRVLGVPQGAGALVAVLPYPQLHVGVHLAQQVAAGRDALHLDNLHRAVTELQRLQPCTGGGKP